MHVNSNSNEFSGQGTGEYNDHCRRENHNIDHCWDACLEGTQVCRVM